MSDSNSPYGKGFAIRMVVLLLLLGAVGFGFYKDGQMTKNATTKISELMNSLTRIKEGGKGLTKTDVQDEFGFAPVSTSNVDKYVVERYEFQRVLPFSKGQFVTVVYNQDQVHDAIANKDFDPNAKSKLMQGVKMMPEGERTMPAAAVAGGGGGGGGGGAPDPAQIVDRIMGSDKDEDGKISKDEASDRLKEGFDDMDEDKDGFLTKEEVEKAIKARMEERENDEEADERPKADSDEAEKTDEAKTDDEKSGEAKTDEGKSGESKDDGEKSDG